VSGDNWPLARAGNSTSIPRHRSPSTARARLAQILTQLCIKTFVGCDTLGWAHVRQCDTEPSEPQQVPAPPAPEINDQDAEQVRQDSAELANHAPAGQYGPTAEYGAQYVVEATPGRTGTCWTSSVSG
jgi:hypothetical protein